MDHEIAVVTMICKSLHLLSSEEHRLVSRLTLVIVTVTI
jgi:hypothetical protein